MSKQSDTLLAFLVGAVAGATAALLLAPDKGSETRRRLRERATGLYQKGETWAGETRHAAAARAERALGTAKEKLHEVEDTARATASALKEAVAEGREAFKREMNKG